MERSNIAIAAAAPRRLDFRRARAEQSVGRRDASCSGPRSRHGARVSVILPSASLAAGRSASCRAGLARRKRRLALSSRTCSEAAVGCLWATNSRRRPVEAGARDGQPSKSKTAWAAASRAAESVQSDDIAEPGRQGLSTAAEPGKLPRP